MATWDKRTIPLDDDHGWSATPGYQVFVADRGAVRFDLPEGWIVQPGENGSIKFHDAPPPDDNAVLEMTVFYLNPEIDWTRLPSPAELLPQITPPPPDDPTAHRGELQTVRRPGLDLAWIANRARDPSENRDAFTYTALAREGLIQPVFTFSFWAVDEPRMAPVWATLLRTLRLGQPIADPATGDVRHKRN